ncbi:MAG: hypothetical protein AAF502_02115 [Bacteroidota bacterium]
MTIFNQIKAVMLLSVFCLVATSFSILDSTEKHPKWLEGEWEGVGLQLNFPSTWSIDFLVKENQYMIMYPSLECGGEWELISANQYKAVFRENILEGVNKCVQGGTVVVTKVDEYHISYSYFSPDSGKLEATSTLVNKKAIDVKKS